MGNPGLGSSLKSFVVVKSDDCRGIRAENIREIDRSFELHSRVCQIVVVDMGYRSRICVWFLVQLNDLELLLLEFVSAKNRFMLLLSFILSAGRC